MKKLLIVLGLLLIPVAAQASGWDPVWEDSAGVYIIPYSPFMIHVDTAEMLKLTLDTMQGHNEDRIIVLDSIKMTTTIPIMYGTLSVKDTLTSQLRINGRTWQAGISTKTGPDSLMKVYIPDSIKQVTTKPHMFGAVSVKDTLTTQIRFSDRIWIEGFSSKTGPDSTTKLVISDSIKQTSTKPHMFGAVSVKDTMTTWLKIPKLWSDSLDVGTAIFDTVETHFLQDTNAVTQSLKVDSLDKYKTANILLLDSITMGTNTAFSIGSRTARMLSTNADTTMGLQALHDKLDKYSAANITLQDSITAGTNAAFSVGSRAARLLSTNADTTMGLQALHDKLDKYSADNITLQDSITAGTSSAFSIGSRSAKLLSTNADTTMGLQALHDKLDKYSADNITLQDSIVMSSDSKWSLGQRATQLLSVITDTSGSNQTLTDKLDKFTAANITLQDSIIPGTTSAFSIGQAGASLLSINVDTTVTANLRSGGSRVTVESTDSIAVNGIFPTTTNTGQVGISGNAYNSVYADTGNFVVISGSGATRVDRLTTITGPDTLNGPVVVSDSMSFATTKPIMFGTVSLKDTLTTQLITTGAVRMARLKTFPGPDTIGGNIYLAGRTEIADHFKTTTGTDSCGQGLVVGARARVNALTTVAGPDTLNGPVVVSDTLFQATTKPIILGTGALIKDTLVARVNVRSLMIDTVNARVANAINVAAADTLKYNLFGATSGARTNQKVGDTLGSLAAGVTSAGGATGREKIEFYHSSGALAGYAQIAFSDSGTGLPVGTYYLYGDRTNGGLHTPNRIMSDVDFQGRAANGGFFSTGTASKPSVLGGASGVNFAVGLAGSAAGDTNDVVVDSTGRLQLKRDGSLINLSGTGGKVSADTLRGNARVGATSTVAGLSLNNMVSLRPDRDGPSIYFSDSTDGAARTTDSLYYNAGIFNNSSSGLVNLKAGATMRSDTIEAVKVFKAQGTSTAGSVTWSTNRQAVAIAGLNANCIPTVTPDSTMVVATDYDGRVGAWCKADSLVIYAPLGTPAGKFNYHIVWFAP